MEGHQFVAFKSFADATFFSALGQHKLEHAKLSEDRVPVRGYVDFGAARDRPPAVRFSAKSLSSGAHPADAPKVETPIDGYVYNYNTIEAFKQLDKREFIADQARALRHKIQSAEIFESPMDLLRFAAVVYSDLKRYKYYYWFCFPSLSFGGTVKDVTASSELDALVERHLEGADDGGVFYAVDHEPTWHIKHLRALGVPKGGHSPHPEGHPEGREHPDPRHPHPLPHAPRAPRGLARVGTVDFGTAQGLPWHLRNLCAALAPYYSEALVYVYKKTGSYWVTVQLGEGDGTVLGWERNSQGKLVPKITDLAALQDPVQLSQQAVDLNLKLMKWRAAPSIDLEGLRQSKVLLLGAGTLGCYVARGLLAWGVRHLSLVDSGTVSYSNPVRQPLFVAEDATQKKGKAEAAAAALAAISPGATVAGHTLEIPMAGHPVTEEQRQHEHYLKLVGLVEAHDVVFLLMDSRESRWLPTVLGKALGKLVLNVAIGFDSWVVMRHGLEEEASEGETTGAEHSPASSSTGPETPPSSSTAPSPTLGCYFCNDVVAPIDSQSNLSLDQMCTVTRPGVALTASAAAVELLATLYQHPLRGRAPHDAATILGQTSHQLRGFLASHQTVEVWGPAFEHCPGCSAQVLSAWRADGWDFVKAALNKRDFLTELSGLGDLQRAVDDLSDLDLSDEFM